MTTVAPEPTDLLQRLVRGRNAAASLTHVERLPPRPGDPVGWPDWTPEVLRAAFIARGVATPWRHQVHAAEFVRSGRHVVVATGTASGKSLAFLLPVLSDLLTCSRATALYLAPTKALAADQLRTVGGLELAGIRPASYDGDTPRAEREWTRQHSRYVLTNPDMLHHGVLPGHAAWTAFLRRLTYVVVDECHTYRGVFGSHVSHVLRRLRRLAARNGSSPRFVLASATVGDPATAGERLTGLPMVAVTDDLSPRGGVTFALWEPPPLPGRDSGRDSAMPGNDSAMPGNADRAAHRPHPGPGRDQRLRPHGGAEDPPPADAGLAESSSGARPSPEPSLADPSPDSNLAESSSGARILRPSPQPSLADPSPNSNLAESSSGARIIRLSADPSLADPSPDTAAAASIVHAEGREPPGDLGVADARPVRKSTLRETADLLADSVACGVRTLAFVRSRRGAEAVATMARRALEEAVPGLGSRVAAYRGGYLREERRQLERGLLDGSLLGLASTNALELGVDLVGLDAVLLAGYPGTLASLWQQSGRAGRTGGEALCVLVARDDPLDTYLVHHPAALFGRPVEATVLDPANPYVLGPQLCCAAAEHPLTPPDLALFGDGAEAAVDVLVKRGALRRRANGWYWTSPGRPDVDLRGAGGAPVAVVESATGRLLGTVDQSSAHVQVHAGAVYLHQGVSYVVDELDLEDAVALVHAEEPEWTTHPRDVTSLAVQSVRSYVDAGPVGLFLGEVEVTAQVVGYQRRRLTGEVIDTRPLDLPPRCLPTVAVWWTASPGAMGTAGVDPGQIPGALHAAEHAAIGLLPLVATCDRWDIGGLSTAAHPDTDAPTVFVYDGHPGGAGFAERAYSVADQWLGATRAAIGSCGCESGCPSCVQSPKCGNGNSPLEKGAAVRLLDMVLGALAEDRRAV